MIHNVTLTVAMVVSVWLGWKHSEESLLDAQRRETPRCVKWRMLWLFLMGAGVMLGVLFDPDVSAARETYASFSTTGFKVFWLFLMGSLVISYGGAQWVFHDVAASFHRFVRRCRA